MIQIINYKGTSISRCYAPDTVVSLHPERLVMIDSPSQSPLTWAGDQNWPALPKKVAGEFRAKMHPLRPAGKNRITSRDVHRAPG